MYTESRILTFTINPNGTKTINTPSVSWTIERWKYFINLLWNPYQLFNQIMVDIITYELTPEVKA